MVRKKRQIVPGGEDCRCDETLNGKCWEKLIRRVQKGLILGCINCTLKYWHPK